MLQELIKIRNNYLKENNKTILDDTPFQEFRIECQGSTIDGLRKNRLKIKDNIKKGKPAKLRYDPVDSNNLKRNKLLEFNYGNSSGKINTSSNRLFTV